jgi:hypothetical protein
MRGNYCWWRFLALAFPILLVAGPEPGWARENMLSGTLALRQEYDSNTNLSATDRRSSWYSVLAPGVLFSSRGPTDQFELGYNLGFKWNHSESEESLEHDFLLRGSKEFSPRWQAGVMNRFYLSDDSDYAAIPIPDVDPELSPRRERDRFRLNIFSVHSDHVFAQYGDLKLGYENRILRHSSATNDDYTRHHPNLNVGYQLSQKWRSEVGYGYVRGDFDREDDLESHLADLRFLYQATHRDRFSLSYGFNRTTYRGPTGDYRLHNLVGGWMRHFDIHTTLTTSAGFTRTERQRHDDHNYLSMAAELNREFRRGALALSGRTGVDEMQFTGGDAGDLSRFRQVRLSGNRQLLERLRADLGLSWRQNDFIDRPDLGRERIYEAFCGLAYALGRGYEVSTRYRYKELDVRNGNGYEDHRLFLELRVVRDLFKW